MISNNNNLYIPGWLPIFLRAPLLQFQFSDLKTKVRNSSWRTRNLLFSSFETVANGGACGVCGDGCGGCAGGWQEATNTPPSTSMEFLRKSWATAINPPTTAPPPPNHFRIRAKPFYLTHGSMDICSFWPDPHPSPFPSPRSRKSRNRFLLPLRQLRQRCHRLPQIR